MLSRHKARAKVLQSLYAYRMSNSHELHIADKQLVHSIEKVFDMFYSQLLLLIKIREFAEIQMEEAKLKRVPTEQDLRPNTRFVENKLIVQLDKNSSLNKVFNDRNILWDSDTNIHKNIFRKFKLSSIYSAYMQAPESSFENDKAVVMKLLKKFVFTHRPLFDYYEDHSIFWVSDYDYTTFVLIKILQALEPETVATYKFPNTRDKDISEVIDFGRTLFKKTVLKAEAYEEVIARHAKNWEMERIALMDNVIMQLALCELLEFPSIPVKVTLNEYIELSKNYSTPKSHTFINGILDNIVDELNKEKKIVKKGRGLMP